MRTFEYTINDPVGIHARPAGVLSKKAKEFASTVTITNPEGKSAEAKKLMALMALGVKTGETVQVTVEGEDEDTAVEALQEFFNEYL